MSPEQQAAHWLARDVPRRLQAWSAHSEADGWWEQLLADGPLQTSPVEMLLAALRAWREAGGPGGPEALPLLLEPLQEAAAGPGGDLRLWRSLPVLLPELLQIPEQAPGLRPALELATVAHDLTAAWWALLGGPGRWCGALGASGPVWAAGPLAPEARRRCLIAAYRAGVPFFQASGWLARDLPDTPAGWLYPTRARLQQLEYQAGLRLDARLERLAADELPAQLPDQAWRVPLDPAGRLLLDLDRPRTLTAPLPGRLCVPFRLRTPLGDSIGALLPDRQQPGGYWAGVAPGAGWGLRTLLVGVLRDLARDEVRERRYQLSPLDEAAWVTCAELRPGRGQGWSALASLRTRTPL